MEKYVSIELNREQSKITGYKEGTVIDIPLNERALTKEDLKAIECLDYLKDYLDNLVKNKEVSCRDAIPVITELKTFRELLISFEMEELLTK